LLLDPRDSARIEETEGDPAHHPDEGDVVAEADRAVGLHRASLRTTATVRVPSTTYAVPRGTPPDTSTGSPLSARGRRQRGATLGDQHGLVRAGGLLDLREHPQSSGWTKITVGVAPSASIAARVIPRRRWGSGRAGRQGRVVVDLLSDVDGLAVVEDVEAEVAAAFGPFVVLLGQAAPTRRAIEARSGRCPRRRCVGGSRGSGARWGC
jgi:hypothetical protein